MKKKFIMKVQLSLFTNENEQQILAYNKDRSVTCQANANKKVTKMMDGALKKYFNVTVEDDCIFLLDEVEEQKW